MKLKGIKGSFFKEILILSGLFIPFFAFSQNDTIKEIEEIKVIRFHKSIEEHSTLNKKQILQLAPADIGELLQYMNGVTVKNYGGIGGMKTLSNRGLGGEHSQLIIDGQPINDAQNGQINFATIQSNNVEQISVDLRSKTQSELLPVSALVKGSNVLIRTYEQEFPTQPISIRSNFTLGSFGQKEAFVAGKIGDQSKFISISGGIGTYKGDYPYRLPFGDTETTYIRKNNALDNYQISLGAGWKWKSKRNHVHTIKINGNTHQIDQQLSGAVVLYNDFNKETLKTWNTHGGIQYHALLGNFRLSTFGTFTHRYLNYHDPNFLNFDGFITNKYALNSVIGGFHLEYKWKNLSLHFGNDFSFDVLENNRNLGNPERQSNISMLKAQFDWKYFSVEASVFSQVFIDENQDFRNNYNQFHPQLSISTSDKLFKNWQLFAWYKPSSRAASFNELYFSQIGNKNLKPEESYQFDIGTRFAKKMNQFDLQIQINGFKNLVKNKILALPTKNMFIWSIQNLGKVDIYGADLNVIGKWNIQQNWGIDFQLGANYQKAMDISEKKSPTYRHQIAYTPEFTGNFMLSGRYKTIGLHVAFLFIGERYSLNENIPSNQLASYFTMDISASYNLILKEKHTIKLHAGIKNATNESYSFIRYYVMPGINYFIKLGYEF